MFPGRSQLFTPIRGYQLGAIRQSFNWSSFLNNAGKTLNVINQAIPVFYQIKPMYNNIRTMFKVTNELRKPDIVKNEEKQIVKQEEKILKNPVFFK